jgi:hypothetical protein
LRVCLSAVGHSRTVSQWIPAEKTGPRRWSGVGGGKSLVAVAVGTALATNSAMATTTRTGSPRGIWQAARWTWCRGERANSTRVDVCGSGRRRTRLSVGRPDDDTRGGAGGQCGQDCDGEGVQACNGGGRGGRRRGGAGPGTVGLCDGLAKWSSMAGCGWSDVGTDRLVDRLTGTGQEQEPAPYQRQGWW